MAQKKLKKMGGKSLEGSGFPEAFVKEIKKFSDRNCLSLGDDAYALCDSCLKAHALKTAEKLGLDRGISKKISKIIDCDAGHNGYYLDKEGIIEL